MPSPMTDASPSLGAGAWGTALAVHLARARRDAARDALGARRRRRRARSRAARANARYLPGIALPDALAVDRATSPRSAGADLLIVGDAGRRAARRRARRSRRAGARAPLVWLSQGLRRRADRALPAGVGARAPGARAALAGAGRRRSRVRASPRKSRAGCRRRVAVAATDAGARRATSRALLRGDTLRAYESDDMAGVEVGGAVKNVLAIAAGASDGLGFGHNARAALITRGLAETGRPVGGAGRPARDADGARRPGRPRADLHRRPVAQPARRPRARAAARRCRRSSPSWATSPRACAPRAAVRALARAPRRRHADLRGGVPRAVRGPAAARRRSRRCCSASRAPESAVTAARRSARSAVSGSAGAGESRLPPRLVDGDRDGVRQVEAAHAGAHRNAQPRVGARTARATASGSRRSRSRTRARRPARSARRRASARRSVVNANQRRGRRASSAARQAAKSRCTRTRAYSW